MTFREPEIEWIKPPRPREAKEGIIGYCARRMDELKSLNNSKWRPKEEVSRDARLYDLFAKLKAKIESDKRTFGVWDCIKELYDGIQIHCDADELVKTKFGWEMLLLPEALGWAIPTPTEVEYRRKVIAEYHGRR